MYLADLKNQTDNLRLLLESVEADLSQRHERRELAETTHDWLVTLRQRLAEVEEDTEEAFRARRQLVRLLVAGISASNRREDGSTEVRITYRFDPPDAAETGGRLWALYRTLRPSRRRSRRRRPPCRSRSRGASRGPPGPRDLASVVVHYRAGRPVQVYESR